jgi:ribA/ribD-fused uncharacterized protein
MPHVDILQDASEMFTGAPSIGFMDLPQPCAYGEFFPFIKGVFSQWHHTPFAIAGRDFVTAEQWMMYGKAVLFQDYERAEQILASPDPALQKRLGQSVSDFEQGAWDRWKIDLVYKGNIAKFRQNPGALRQLRNTGLAMLVEANPRDWVWGTGRSVDDPVGHDAAHWRGQNLLGRILTKVRDEIA